MQQDVAAVIKRDMERTYPLREPIPLVNVFHTPYQAFPFVGPGPFYDFEIYRWNGISAASALNYFARIGARVIQQERRSYVVDGGTCDDGQTDWYDYFLVEWHEAPPAADAVDPPVGSTGNPTTREKESSSSSEVSR